LVDAVEGLISMRKWERPSRLLGSVSGSMEESLKVRRCFEIEVFTVVHPSVSTATSVAAGVLAS
jgi:hypothetical protein